MNKHNHTLKKKFQVWILDGLLYILQEFDTIEQCQSVIEKLNGYKVYYMTQQITTEIE
jgi:hypothetical protein